MTSDLKRKHKELQDKINRLSTLCPVYQTLEACIECLVCESELLTLILEEVAQNSISINAVIRR